MVAHLNPRPLPSDSGPLLTYVSGGFLTREKTNKGNKAPNQQGGGGGGGGSGLKGICWAQFPDKKNNEVLILKKKFPLQ